MGNGRPLPPPDAKSAPPPSSLSAAEGWQPLTPSGVAAYAKSPLRRVVILQFISAAAIALVAGWFCSSSILPTIRQALDNLSEEGRIRLGELKLIQPPASRTHPLAANHWLALDVEATSNPSRNPARALEILAAGNGIYLLSSLGSTRIPYPVHWDIPLNRIELLATWQAWEPLLYASLLLAVFSGMLASWWILATFLCLLPRILAYFSDRDLTLAGAWKLSAAALIPGALLMTVGWIALEVDSIDLVKLALLFVVHLLVSPVYALLATCHLTAASALRSPSPNPFDPKPAVEPPTESSQPVPTRKPANPFAAPK